jgi:hypothetical protein
VKGERQKGERKLGTSGDRLLQVKGLGYKVKGKGRKERRRADGKRLTAAVKGNAGRQKKMRRNKLNQPNKPNELNKPNKQRYSTL